MWDCWIKKKQNENNIINKENKDDAIKEESIKSIDKLNEESVEQSNISNEKINDDKNAHPFDNIFVIEENIKEEMKEEKKEEEVEEKIRIILEMKNHLKIFSLGFI